NADCRRFLLHTIPSRGMLADALAQYLVKKTWTRWLLVAGATPEDALYAEAVRHAAKRFGGNVVAERSWAATFDARRTAQEEVPVLTQGERYDVLVVADEAGAFGDYLLYRTWDPRPVAGTQGLVAAGWLPTQEQWGALQLHSRFEKRADRLMTARDYAAWAAVRSVGEAAIRIRSADPAAIDAYIRSPEFELAAFKGRKLSYRAWDGQMRQPIPLGWARALVSMSPQEGFLHPATELDTLGTDAPETGCKVAATSPEPKQR
ncbi:MAG TPA: branched-chain amino acid ABC transporter substrate-binding protein, partial [Rhodospirillales bacterium]|nr:branched-chain amino acid ABC transporter substrate-binding protein [Rhodospirillales bacterium]